MNKKIKNIILTIIILLQLLTFSTTYADQTSINIPSNLKQLDKNDQIYYLKKAIRGITERILVILEPKVLPKNKWATIDNNIQIKILEHGNGQKIKKEIFEKEEVEFISADYYPISQNATELILKTDNLYNSYRNQLDWLIIEKLEKAIYKLSEGTKAEIKFFINNAESYSSQHVFDERIKNLKGEYITYYIDIKKVNTFYELYPEKIPGKNIFYKTQKRKTNFVSEKYPKKWDKINGSHVSFLDSDGTISDIIFNDSEFADGYEFSSEFSNYEKENIITVGDNDGGYGFTELFEITPEGTARNYFFPRDFLNEEMKKWLNPGFHKMYISVYSIN